MHTTQHFQQAPALPSFFTVTSSAFSLGPRGFRFAGWELRLRSRRLISPEGKEVSLTKTECTLLQVLLHRPRQIMSREQIMDMAQTETSVFDRAVDVQMLRLRRKVETSGNAPALLKTKRGAGYFLDADVQVLN
ncbi:MAG: winged helix-turn-helix domain-containing protein [Comamonas sp.]|jgi:DNA-binding response OmpR family regulator|nr:winged helix-turn-helix domain-containing protein [Comamonas sp.]